jgi:Homeobox KN domain
MQTPSCRDNSYNIKSDIKSSSLQESKDIQKDKLSSDTPFPSPCCFGESFQPYDDDHGESRNQFSVVTPPHTPLVTSSKAVDHQQHQPTGTDTRNTFDDLQKAMLLHEDFTKLLSLVRRMRKRQQYNKLNEVSEDTSSSSSFPTTVNPAPFQTDSNDDAIITMMKESLLSKAFPHRTFVIHRGQYQALDAFIDRCVTLLEQQIMSVSHQQPDMSTLQDDMEVGTTSSQGSNQVQKNGNKSQGRKKAHIKEAIVTKYPKHQIDILMNWMIENKTNPCPDAKQIEDLSHRTGLNASQIVNWTTNVRKRNLKATCKGNKKPHHFIDFLFLSQARQTTNGTADQFTNSSNMLGRSNEALTAAKKQRHRNKRNSMVSSIKVSNNAVKRLRKTYQKRKHMESHKRKNAKKMVTSDSFDSLLDIEKYIFGDEATVVSPGTYDDDSSFQLFSDPLWDFEEEGEGNDLHEEELDEWMMNEHNEELEPIGADRNKTDVKLQLEDIDDMSNGDKVIVHKSVAEQHWNQKKYMRYSGDSESYIRMKSSFVPSIHGDKGSSSGRTNIKHCVMASPLSILPPKTSYFHTGNDPFLMLNDYEIEDYDNPIDVNDPVDDNVLEDFVLQFDQSVDHHATTGYLANGDYPCGRFAFDGNRYMKQEDIYD